LFSTTSNEEIDKNKENNSEEGKDEG